MPRGSHYDPVVLEVKLHAPFLYRGHTDDDRINKRRNDLELLRETGAVDPEVDADALTGCEGSPFLAVLNLITPGSGTTFSNCLAKLERTQE